MLWCYVSTQHIHLNLIFKLNRKTVLQVKCVGKVFYVIRNLYSEVDIRDYVDRWNLPSIKLANMHLIYWSIRSSRRRGWDGIKRVEEGVVVILNNYKLRFIRVHDNFVQNPSNNNSIIKKPYKYCIDLNLWSSIVLILFNNLILIFFYYILDIIKTRVTKSKRSEPKKKH